MRRLAAVLALLLAFPLVLVGCDDRGNQKLNDANSLLDLGKFDEAEKLIQEVIAKYPDHAKAYNNLGFCYFNEKQYDKARQAYQKALELYQKTDSGNTEELANTYDNLGFLDDMTGDNTAALNLYQKAMDTDPNMWRPVHNLATLYRELKQYDKAIETFDKALEIDPYAYQTRTFKALTLLDAGRTKDAAKLYSELLAENPFQVYLQTQLAYAYLKGGELDKAAQVLANCQAMNPGSMETQSFIALLLFKQGKKDEAMKLVEQLVDIVQKPDASGAKAKLTAMLSRNFGLAYVEAGQPDKASDWLGKARKLDPTDHETEAALAALSGQAPASSSGNAPASSPTPGASQPG
jgi:tetratricopeptide (TPR) repeat protein